MWLLLLQAFNILDAVAVLVLVSLGLGVIYGMMRVINLAHGELLMLGAYATVVATDAGVNVWLSMLVIAPLAAGLAGLVIERCLIRFLYGRILDTMLATWGLSLALVGAVTMVFGNSVRGVSAPVPSFPIGPYQGSGYGAFVIVVALATALALFAVLRATRFGLIVRATMQNPGMAAALGVSPQRVYMMTFALGSALAGLAGGVLAPISGSSPTMGGAYIAKAFITVLGGGAAIVTGTGIASGLFGFISETVSFHATPVVGEVAMLATAILMLRVLPQGITGRYLRRSL